MQLKFYIYQASLVKMVHMINVHNKLNHDNTIFKTKIQIRNQTKKKTVQ